MLHKTLTVELCQKFLMQIELVKILNFICRDNSNVYYQEDTRRYHKKSLKGAQRYLEVIRGVKEHGKVGDVAANEGSLKFWRERKQRIVELYSIILENNGMKFETELEMICRIEHIRANPDVYKFNPDVFINNHINAKRTYSKL